MNRPVDLDECAREPIHVPGSIQPHGTLLALARPDLEIVVESANAAALLGTDGSLLGRPLAELVPEETAAALLRHAQDDVRDANPIELNLPDGKPAHAIAHESDGLLVLEIEPLPDDERLFTAATQRLVRRFDGLRRTETVQELCDLMATEIRGLTRFDRVMVYRFDAQDNGQVVAEDAAPGMPSFLGLHFPESDIPAQARELYRRNPLRLIADAEYEPVPLVPPTNPSTGGPLDLSHSTLRSVSPIHCEYLKNMGVRASMSISLIVDDRLWGLVACHHRTPHHVPYATRLVGEFVAHVFSARVGELDRIEGLHAKTAAYQVQTRLMQQMFDAPQFEEGLSDGPKTLADLIPCDGAAVLYRGRVLRMGAAPTEEQLRRLAGWLSSTNEMEVVQTDCLGEVFPEAMDWTVQAAGMIAVPISTEPGDLLLWFRKEARVERRWAGDPNKLEVGEGGRLSPRGSFEEWREKMSGRATPWLDWEVEVASDFRTALIASVVHQATELERLNAELNEESRQRKHLLAAVSHELRTPLHAIAGWAQLARTGLEGDELERALDTIERNVQAQSRLIDDLLDISRLEGGRITLQRESCDAREIVERTVESLLPVALAHGVELQTSAATEDSRLSGDPGRLQQVVWNLVNNAIKFSREGGTVLCHLARDESGLTIEVRDDGIGIEPGFLASVFQPFRQERAGSKRSEGLGLGLAIVRSIVQLHGGAIHAESEGRGRGATFRISLPT